MSCSHNFLLSLTPKYKYIWRCAESNYFIFLKKKTFNLSWKIPKLKFSVRKFTCNDDDDDDDMPHGEAGNVTSCKEGLFSIIAKLVLIYFHFLPIYYVYFYKGVIGLGNRSLSLFPLFSHPFTTLYHNTVILHTSYTSLNIFISETQNSSQSQIGLASLQFIFEGKRKT